MGLKFIPPKPVAYCQRCQCCMSPVMYRNDGRFCGCDPVMYPDAVVLLGDEVFEEARELDGFVFGVGYLGSSWDILGIPEAR